MPVYPFYVSDYPTVVCLFSHHMWMGGIFTLGAGAHASIFLVRDYAIGTKDYPIKPPVWSLPIELVLCQRDIIIGLPLSHHISLFQDQKITRE